MELNSLIAVIQGRFAIINGKAVTHRKRYTAIKSSLICFGLLVTLASASISADEIAPSFTLKELEGDKEFSLEQYRGKVVYLDFWASWCGPCRQSIPALNKFQNEIGNEKFEVVAINLDANPQDAIDFLLKYPVDYTVLADASGGTSRRYDLVGLPTSVLIAPDGTLVKSFKGFHPNHLKKLKKAIHILNGD